MYRANYIESLRQELVDLVEKQLSPTAVRYGFSEVSLGTGIKWRPIVLLLGNYSSGKSTLINELLGKDVQITGQAPTDDAFTVITCPDTGSTDDVEVRDGKVLLNDDRYPFAHLRKYGERFASHFALKKVDAPILSRLAIIDTPGMLDSSSEGNRGYNYQEVVGELAQIADLIVVMFDPHKAGTVNELNQSLRVTLPKKTFEDRVVFVLNRIDECSNMMDLLRTYGTLCWNLSQVTSRKDIPYIILSHAADKEPPSFLNQLDNQRPILLDRINQAPKLRLDNLASFIETQGERLTHFLEAILSYKKRLSIYKFKFSITALLTASLAAAITWVFAISEVFLNLSGETLAWGSSGLVFLGVLAIFYLSFNYVFYKSWRYRILGNVDRLTTLKTQHREDTWAAVSHRVKHFLKENESIPRGIRKDYLTLQQNYLSSAKHAREALAELDTIKPDEE